MPSPDEFSAEEIAELDRVAKAERDRLRRREGSMAVMREFGGHAVYGTSMMRGSAIARVELESRAPFLSAMHGEDQPPKIKRGHPLLRGVAR